MNRLGLAPQSSMPFGREQMRDIPAVRVIPYEYVANFTLQGGDRNVGNLLQDVINVSVEGVFVAVSIGYGLVEEPAEAFQLITPPTRLPPSHSVTSRWRTFRLISSSKAFGSIRMSVPSLYAMEV
jgi:hypothetical protein